LYKIELHVVLPQKEKREKEESSQKKTPILERGGREYVLYSMVETFPTCHAERSPLKATAL